MAEEVEPASNTCAAILDFAEAESQTASWFDVWAGAVGVLKLCVGKGQQGTSYVKGWQLMLLFLGWLAKMLYRRPLRLDDLVGPWPSMKSFLRYWRLRERR